MHRPLGFLILHGRERQSGAGAVAYQWLSTRGRDAVFLPFQACQRPRTLGDWLPATPRLTASQNLLYLTAGPAGCQLGDKEGDLMLRTWRAIAIRGAAWQARF
jgi:hypothetical protein